MTNTAQTRELIASVKTAPEVKIRAALAALLALDPPGAHPDDPPEIKEFALLNEGWVTCMETVQATVRVHLEGKRPA